MDPILKGQTVDIALDHLSLSGTLINPTGEDQKDFLRFQEAMLAGWENEGIFIGFHFSDFGIDSDATDIAGFGYSDVSAVSLCLAVYGASSRGLTAPQELRKEAFIAKMALQPTEVITREVISTLPQGMGQRDFSTYGNPYQDDLRAITVESGGNLDDLEF